MIQVGPQIKIDYVGLALPVLPDSSSITAPSLLHKHTRSKGPFLRRHYPASQVL